MPTSDRWLRVWTRDGGYLCVDPSEEPRIDAAVQQWVDMGRDTLLTMRTIHHDCVYLASQLIGWTLSTPESRALDAQQEARDKDERKANRQAAGLPFDEDT